MCDKVNGPLSYRLFTGGNGGGSAGGGGGGMENLYAAMEEKDAEITRLRAALATARRDALAEIKQDTDELIEQGRQDGMEQAAQIAENEPEPEGEPPPELHGRSVKNIAIASVRATKREIAAAIRAASGEGKP
jgi:hypothetical protein